jgi:hypothetical protein
LPFLSSIYSSFSQRSSPLFKFEKTFEAIRKNDRDCKETLRRYNFRKPKKEEGTSEQVGLIFIFDFEEEKQKDDLQQHQEASSQQEEPTHEQIPTKVHIPNKKRSKRRNQQVMVTNLRGKKVQIHENDEVRYVHFYSYKV